MYKESDFKLYRQACLKFPRFEKIIFFFGGGGVLQNLWPLAGGRAIRNFQNLRCAAKHVDVSFLFFTPTYQTQKHVLCPQENGCRFV